jgi:hypothetical protein
MNHLPIYGMTSSHHSDRQSGRCLGHHRGHRFGRRPGHRLDRHAGYPDRRRLGRLGHRHRFDHHSHHLERRHGHHAHHHDRRRLGPHSRGRHRVLLGCRRQLAA